MLQALAPAAAAPEACGLCCRRCCCWLKSLRSPTCMQNKAQSVSRYLLVLHAWHLGQMLATADGAFGKPEPRQWRHSAAPYVQTDKPGETWDQEEALRHHKTRWHCTPESVHWGAHPKKSHVCNKTTRLGLHKGPHVGGDEVTDALLPRRRPQRPQLALAAVQRQQPALHRNMPARSASLNRRTLQYTAAEPDGWTTRGPR